MGSFRGLSHQALKVVTRDLPKLFQVGEGAGVAAGPRVLRSPGRSWNGGWGRDRTQVGIPQLCEGMISAPTGPGAWRYWRHAAPYLAGCSRPWRWFSYSHTLPFAGSFLYGTSLLLSFSPLPGSVFRRWTYTEPENASSHPCNIPAFLLPSQGKSRRRDFIS